MLPAPGLSGVAFCRNLSPMNPAPLVAAIAVAAVLSGCATTVSRTTVRTLVRHRGWHDAVVMANGQVEAVLVPSVGRLMQFRFVGSQDGPLWENTKLAGAPMPPKPWEASHGSFGGDKTWPAPQSVWNWPPPDVFDAAPLAFRVQDDASVVLVSPVSPRFGIRTERKFSLAPDAPVLRVVTTYERVTAGKDGPAEVSVWVITQAKDPVAMFIPVPASGRFPQGTSEQWGIPKDDMTVRDGLLRLTRDRKDSHKVGNDAGSMVWVGDREVLRIDIGLEPGATYPDGGCSAEIYTNPDPTPYVELETLGPLRALKAGQRLSATNTYTLLHRDGEAPEAAARRALAR